MQIFEHWYNTQTVSLKQNIGFPPSLQIIYFFVTETNSLLLIISASMAWASLWIDSIQLSEERAKCDCCLQSKDFKFSRVILGFCIKILNTSQSLE